MKDIPKHRSVPCIGMIMVVHLAFPGSCQCPKVTPTGENYYPEPPYKATAEASASGHVGLDHGARDLLDEGPAASYADSRGRPGPGQFTLARVETRANVSPGQAGIVRRAASKL